ncbi:tetratricopeptide repeat protein 36, partial [Paraphysoderma sedebokerense]
SIPPEILSTLQKTELEGVKAAEEKDLTKAIEIFTECIKLCPEYASAYNNRAQTYRLQGHDDLAMEDLNKAIEYAAGDAEILKQSYTQRGIIHKKLNNPEAALADFQKGAQFGNEIARMASVQENPYAQLCGATLQEVMKNLGAPK